MAKTNTLKLRRSYKQDFDDDHAEPPPTNRPKKNHSIQSPVRSFGSFLTSSTKSKTSDSDGGSKLDGVKFHDFYFQLS